MNTRKTAERLPLFSRMAFRLWLGMMALVLLCIAFLWTGQVLLFERGYASVAMQEMKGRLEPVMEELETEDLAENPDLIFYLSKAANGKLMLTDESGRLLAMYTYGHPVDLEEASEGNATWKSIRCSEEYRGLLQGESYQKVEREKGIPISFEIGIPTYYQGQRAYAVLYRVLNEIQTVLRMNRQQLAILSLLLALSAALLAAVLARSFTRPIRQIKRTVDRLAAGELTPPSQAFRGWMKPASSRARCRSWAGRCSGWMCCARRSSPMFPMSCAALWRSSPAMPRWCGTSAGRMRTGVRRIWGSSSMRRAG